VGFAALRSVAIGTELPICDVKASVAIGSKSGLSANLH